LADTISEDMMPVEDTDTMVELYLKGEALSTEDAKKKRTGFVWYGYCDRSNSKVVKELCAQSDDDFRKTMWDHARKLWGTTRIDNVVSLVASGLWSPAGLPESKKAAVAIGAKRIVDERVAKEREVLERDERAAKCLQDKKVADALEQETARRKKDELSWIFGDVDSNDAWTTYGLRREILDASRAFQWLGPVTSSPMIRIRRWFQFSHNVEAGVKAVVERDFEPAYKLYVQARNERLAAETRPGTSNRNRKRAMPSSQLTFEEIKRQEMVRIQQIQDGLKGSVYDEHALALKSIVDKAATQTVSMPTYIRACPTCKSKPNEQFMDCSCNDIQSESWSVCKYCNCVFNPSKLTCLCIS